jgi:hypothetical protein
LPHEAVWAFFTALGAGEWLINFIRLDDEVGFWFFLVAHQYSSGSKIVVELLSASVMIQSFSPLSVK